MLPQDEIERLQPYLKRVTLTVGQRLCEEPVPSIWFPERGAASCLVHLLTGETVEAGIIGKDGVLGLPLILGGDHGVAHCTVQIAGSAIILSAADFNEHVRGSNGPLLSALLLYTNLYMSTLSQLTACHCLHRIEQRLSRCLLMLHDHSPSSDLRITHDTLSDFLGVHRPSISYALQALAADGAIVLERRRVVVSDAHSLKKHACECYTVIRESTDRELGQTRSLARIAGG